MTKDGQLPKASIAQRLDPARVRQLEQQTALQSAMLVKRAMDDVSGLCNSLHILAEQAQAGHAYARSLCRLLGTNLELARAAAAGIAVVSETPTSPS